MMDKKTTGGFSKIRKLIAVLQKCNGQAVIGDGGALIPPAAAKVLVYACVLILAAGIFAGVYMLQPFAAGFIKARSLTQSLMLVLLIMSFVLAVKNIVTILYTSNDLELLLPMPFSAGQIVTAKVVAASVFPAGLCFIVLNAVCLGYGIREGQGIPFMIGTVLSGVLIPVTGISAAVLLVVIVFRLFGFIRNRDMTIAIGGIFTFGLTAAHIFINSGLKGDGGSRAAAALNVVFAVSGAFPNIFFMNRFMFEGSIIGLALSLAITAVVIVLAVLAVRAFYFDTALSMQNTGTTNKAVTKASLQSGGKGSALKALISYEAKSSRRNPAYMIYGFAMSFLWPVLFALPMFLRNDILSNDIAIPLGTVPAVLGFLAFSIAASGLSCGFNILPGTAFSREGSTFSAIRALPVDLKDYFRSKRNFSMLICSLGSVLYVIILGIVCAAAGFISVGNVWLIPAGACVSFLLDLIFIDLMLLKNSRKPYLAWDSETEFSRKLGAVNIVAVVLGVIMFIVCLVDLKLAPMLDAPGIQRMILVISAAVVLVIFVLAIAVNSLVSRKVPENLMKFE